MHGSLFIGTLLQAIYVIQDHRHVSLFVVIITIISVTFIITIISVTFPTDYRSALFVIVVIMLQCIPYTTHWATDCVMQDRVHNSLT